MLLPALSSLRIKQEQNRNKNKNADIAPGKKELILAPEATSKQLMPSNLQLKGWWQETRIHQPTNFLDTLVFHELGPLTNRPAFQLVFNRLSGLLLICWQVHALQQGPHSVPILGRAHVVHRSLSHSSRFRKKKKNMAMRKKNDFTPED